nr:vegetative cell wall protein gp1-like [Aegilops tauschii subsp. strangulata]
MAGSCRSPRLPPLPGVALHPRLASTRPIHRPEVRPPAPCRDQARPLVGSATAAPASCRQPLTPPHATPQPCPVRAAASRCCTCVRPARRSPRPSSATAAATVAGRHTCLPCCLARSAHRRAAPPSPAGRAPCWTSRAGSTPPPPACARDYSRPHVAPASAASPCTARWSPAPASPAALSRSSTAGAGRRRRRPASPSPWRAMPAPLGLRPVSPRPVKAYGPLPSRPHRPLFKKKM